MKPELSKSSQYWIDRHRYYELKHFCLQYPIWKRIRANLKSSSSSAHLLSIVPIKISEISDPTARLAEARAYYSDRINMLESVARKTDPAFGYLVFRGVTEGISYDVMNARQSLYISREDYYNLYRRFFWLLDQARQ